MDENLSLSICIPTCNRAYSVGRLLETILPMAEKYEIEILVSDNFSSDDTESVCRSFERQNKNFVYYRQCENIGPDRNFEFVLKNAKGKYRWLLGDSNFVDAANLSKIITLIASEDADLLVLGNEKRNAFDKEKYYTDANELLREIGWHITWISALVFNARLVENANFRRYYDSYFIQTGIIFEYLSINNGIVHFIPTVNVVPLNIPKRNGWHSNALEVFCRKWYLFVYSLPLSYEYESKQMCVYDHGVRSGLFSYVSCIWLRRIGGITLRKIITDRFFIKCCVRNAIYLFMILLCLIPRFVFDCLSKIKYAISGKDRNIYKNDNKERKKRGGYNNMIYYAPIMREVA